MLVLETILANFSLKLFLFSVIIVFCLSYLFDYAKFKYQNLPPGPYGFPIVGYLPFMTLEPHLKFMKLAKKYGNVFRIRFGKRPVVVLNDYQSIKEAASKEEFLFRPENTCFDKFDRIFPNFANLNDHQWREERKFAFHSLKDMGMNKQNVQVFIQDTIQELIKTVNDYEGKQCPIKELINLGVSNVICFRLFGERFDINDTKGIEIRNGIIDAGRKLGQTGALSFLPGISTIMKMTNFIKFQKENDDINQELGNVFDKYIKEHRKTFDPENMRDYIDYYLKEQKDRLSREDNTFNDEILRGNLFALLSGATDTVANSLQWLLLFMAGYPEIQEKVRKEIIEHIGTERLPVLEDKKNMPYVNAVIMEQQRWATVLPLGVFRCPSQDTSIQGYTIKKGTVVFFNLYGMHHDSKYWNHPDEFNPARFLDENGQLNSKVEAYAPFSSGKRSCPGEFLAQIELFLFFTFLLQKYEIAPPVGGKVDYSPQFEVGGALLEPKMEMLRLISI